MVNFVNATRLSGIPPPFCPRKSPRMTPFTVPTQGFNGTCTTYWDSYDIFPLRNMYTHWIYIRVCVELYSCCCYTAPVTQEVKNSGQLANSCSFSGFYVRWSQSILCTKLCCCSLSYYQSPLFSPSSVWPGVLFFSHFTSLQRVRFLASLETVDCTHSTQTIYVSELRVQQSRWAGYNFHGFASQSIL